MFAVINRLPVKEGAAGQVAELFASSHGNVQEFPGFVSMEVLRSESEDEVLVSRAGETKTPLTRGSKARSSVHRLH